MTFSPPSTARSVAGDRKAKRATSRKGSHRSRSNAHDLVDLIDAALLKTVNITENGRKRRVTTFTALLLQLWKAEMNGEARAMRTRLNFEKLARSLRVKQQPRFIVEGGLPQVLDAPGGRHVG